MKRSPGALFLIKFRGLATTGSCFTNGKIGITAGRPVNIGLGMSCRDHGDRY